jgi:hypothetical protein
LITYSNRLALHGSEAFELLCFSCGIGGGSSSSNNNNSNNNSGGSSSPVDGCVEALFYVALGLQAAQLPHLAGCPGVELSLSAAHNAIVLLK